VRTVDCSYTISEERIRAYLEIPEIDRLRWLDELVRFTLLWRAAPEAWDDDRSGSAAVHERDGSRADPTGPADG
jgi:hypothetical protein